MNELALCPGECQPGGTNVDGCRPHTRPRVRAESYESWAESWELHVHKLWTGAERSGVSGLIEEAESCGRGGRTAGAGRRKPEPVEQKKIF